MRLVSPSLRRCGWLALAMMLTAPAAALAQGGGKDRGNGTGSTQCAPGQVCTQSVTPPGGDTSPPSITFTPGTGTTVYSPSLTVTVGFCDNATLSTATRTITFNGSSAPYNYTTTTRTGCGAYGSAQVLLTPAAGTNTLAAGICDGSGNCTTGSASYTYVSGADQTAPTVQIAPGTQTTSTGSFWPVITWCDERKLGTTHTISFNGVRVDTAGWTYDDAPASGWNDRKRSTGRVQLAPGDNVLAATVLDSAGNSGTQTVTYTYRPAIDTSPMNQTGATVGLAHAVASYTTVPYVSLGASRSVTLVYTSYVARPTFTLQVDVTDNSNDPAPVTSLGLMWNGVMQVLPDGRTEIHYNTGAGTSRLMALYNSALTRMRSFDMSAVVTRRWGPADNPTRIEQFSVPVRQINVNEKDSYFGWGWMVAGLERVMSNNDSGILVTHGDGSATWYPPVTGCTPQKVCYFGHSPGEFGSMTYDSVNARYVRTGVDGTRTTFDANGYLTSVQDRLGNTQTYAYSGGRLATITDPAGLVTTFSYDGNGKLAGITDPAGRQTRFLVNAAGDLETIIDPDGTTARQFTYFGTHRMQSDTDRGGRQTSYTYDLLGQLATVQSPAYTAEGGQTFRLTTSVTSPEAATEGDYRLGTPSAPLPRVDPVAVRASVTDPRGRVTRFALDGWGLPSRVESPQGYIRTAVRNAEAQLTSEVDEAGNQTTYVWSEGNLTQVTAPQGTVNFSHDGFGQVTEVSGAAPATLNWYNPNTGVLDSTWVAGEKTRYTYDARGRVRTETDPQGHVTTTVYNDTSVWKNPYSVSSGGRTVTYRYDGYGRVAGVKDATGQETRYQYDILNRTRYVTTPDNGVTEYAWGPVFLDRVTDARGQSYQWTRNALGWVEREVRPGDPPGKNLTAAYDRYGRVDTVTNRRNQPVSFTYDAWDRVATRTADGQTTTFSYSPDDPAHPSAPTWMAVANAESVDTVRYDAKGRLTHAITARPFAGGWQRYTTQPHYNAIGQLTGVGIATPAGRDTLGFGYDAQTYRLRNFTDLALGITSIGYSDEGLPNQTTLPNGLVSTQQYSSTHMPEEIRYLGSVTLDNAAGVRYRYDALNRIQTRSSADGGSRREYTYDAGGGWLGAFTDWQATGSGRPACSLSPDDGYVCDNSTATWNATAAETYAYDLAGNPTDRGAVVGAGNRLSQFNGYALTYDDDGNLATKTAPGFSQIFTWNALGQLASVTTNGVTVSYFYDGMGQRVRRVANAVTTGYLYDGINLLYELDGNGAIAAKYTYYPGTLTPHSVVRGGVTYYYATDTQGSVLALFNGSNQLMNQYRYRPFGEPQSATENIPNRIRFAGRELESESGLYYNNARWYDPSLHRFISQDPIGIDGGINLYAYAGNDPVNFVDPSGLYCMAGVGGNVHKRDYTFTHEEKLWYGYVDGETWMVCDTRQDYTSNQPCQRVSGPAPADCVTRPPRPSEWVMIGTRIRQIVNPRQECAGTRVILETMYEKGPDSGAFRIWEGDWWDHGLVLRGTIRGYNDQVLLSHDFLMGSGPDRPIDRFVVVHEGLHIYASNRNLAPGTHNDRSRWPYRMQAKCIKGG